MDFPKEVGMGPMDRCQTVKSDAGVAHTCTMKGMNDFSQIKDNDCTKKTSPSNEEMEFCVCDKEGCNSPPSVKPAPSVKPTPSVKPSPSLKPIPSVKPTPSLKPTPSVKPTPSLKPTPSAKSASISKSQFANQVILVVAVSVLMNLVN